MPDLSLREKIEEERKNLCVYATSRIDKVFNCECVGCKKLNRILVKIDAHERDLVARIEAMRNSIESQAFGPHYRHALNDVLALIKPVVKESLCPAKPENRDTTAVACGTSDTTPRDERPARKKVLEYGSQDAEGIIEAIDAAADRIARALEGRK